jgi:hypothetical protein
LTGGFGAGFGFFTFGGRFGVLSPMIRLPVFDRISFGPMAREDRIPDGRF